MQHRGIVRVIEGKPEPTNDHLAVEEPLEIQIGTGPAHKRSHASLAITMRTPGHDFELALGFLFTEGIVCRPEEVIQVRYTAGALAPEAQTNAVLVDLSPGLQVDMDRFSRHFYTTSSCGVCGKASIDLVRTAACHFPIPGHPQLTPQTLHRLNPLLLESQAMFEKTGGLHAAALFDAAGNLALLREDVGRHNALDKLIGAALRAGMIPLKNHLVLVSGRASFELVQKAAMAGLPVLAAVGAPSSLAVELAEEHGMTLVGFLRNNSFNLYCGQNRVIL